MIIPTTNEQMAGCFRRLMDHNGGWAVIGTSHPKVIGQTGEQWGFRFAVIAESHEQEAYADAAFLGLPLIVLPSTKYWYRIMVD